MAESVINNLLLGVSRDPPESDVNRQKFIKCIVTGNSKQYLEKDYTEEQAKKLSSEEVKTCSTLGITNQDVKTWNLTHLQT